MECSKKYVRSNISHRAQHAGLGSFFQCGFVGRDTEKIFGFEFLAPAFDFRVVENFPEHAAEQSFQRRIFEFAEALDGLLFVAFVILEFYRTNNLLAIRYGYAKPR